MDFPLLRGAIRHMKLIGTDPDHKALRHRNEARLEALKAAHRLYEDKNHESVASRDFRSEYNNQRNSTFAERCASSGRWNDPHPTK